MLTVIKSYYSACDIEHRLCDLPEKVIFKHMCVQSANGGGDII